jgi:hypothetical protein
MTECIEFLQSSAYAEWLCKELLNSGRVRERFDLPNLSLQLSLGFKESDSKK